MQKNVHPEAAANDGPAPEPRPEVAAAIQALCAGEEALTEALTEARTGPAARAFEARVQRFTEHGLELEQAQAWAECLERRDADLDDRRICLECSQLGRSGRCIAAARGRLLGASPQLVPVATILQRCEGFGLRKGLL